MATDQLASGKIAFQAEGRLLQELGLRLVAKPEVALVELIKNSYDADSPTCTVTLEGKDTLVVEDKGLGMTLDDFTSRWMRIATPGKVARRVSARYCRPLTGAKGIGRFAVRYLGDKLKVESVAFDKDRDCLTKLTAEFDWPTLDAAEDLSQAPISYTLVRQPAETETGTTLTIQKLRSATNFTKSTQLRNEVLRIVSPLPGLEKGRFERTVEKDDKNREPGFKVVLPGEQAENDLDVAEYVLGNHWGRLTIDHKGEKVEYNVWLPGFKKPKVLSLKVETAISNGFFADIRYFPRRKGIFSGKAVAGQKAWSWVRSHCGVKVVDHGFYVRPYGFEQDDWLKVDTDKSHSRRDWRTKIAQKHFPVSPTEKAEPKYNPALYLPYNFQVVGAVFVATRRDMGGKDEVDLLPAMDREGLIENAAYEQLEELVRAGIEFLAHEDKAEIDHRLELEAKAEAKTAREEIRNAIEHIAKSPTLKAGDKSSIIKHYRELDERLQKQEDYQAQSRHSLMTMSLLGVVAGFMTHESRAMVHDLEGAVSQVKELAKKNPALAKVAEDLAERLGRFKGYLNYSRLFVQGVRASEEKELSASGQVRFVLDRFKAFAEERNIKVTNDIEDGVMTPPLPVTVYSGVLLNLYTNALKAVIAHKSSVSKPHITFKAWNERGKHVLEVADNGVGIPKELQKRIWDPLYTTTSDIGNPLGSGMGLGLTLTRQVVAELGGRIFLVEDPPPGFSTCFRVEFKKG